MMKKGVVIFLTFALICLTLGTASALTEGVALNTDAKELTVRLEENASTGYEWTLKIPKECDILALKDEVTEYIGANEAVGVSGTRIYTFELIQAGSAELTFEYQRAWESGEPIRTVTVTISISKSGSVSFGAEGFALDL